ncbi:MAG: hypothetical protein ACTHM7_14175 [Ginsengibacter sp.]
MEPIIINENLDYQNNEIKKIKDYCAGINRTLKDFAQKTQYSLTLNEVESLIKGQDVISLEDNILQAQKIKSPLMMDAARPNLRNYIKDLGRKLGTGTYDHCNQYLPDMQMSKGEIYLPEEKEAEIRESFRNLIKSEAGKTFYELHTRAAKALSEFSVFVHENTRLSFISPGELSTEFFDFEDENKSVEIEEVDYDRLIIKNPVSESLILQ